MSLPVILRPEAEEDLQRTRDDLELARTGLGDRFLSEVQSIFDRLESMPEMYGTVWQDVRAVRLKRLRYVVYYVVFADRVEVLAVLHSSRDASTWQPRR
jgi:toxin ParE1/3/4